MTRTPAIDVRRSGHRLRPDPSRVLAKLFIPGQEGVIEGESRAGSVVERVLKLDDDEAAATLAEVVASFSGRHTDLDATLDEHFELVSHRIEHPAELSSARRRLVGAYFTQEYAVESAAICNPSIVHHPDQSDLGRDEARFVLSIRAVGEGHRSSIEFRTGVIDPGSELHFDVPGAHLSSGRAGPCHYRRDLFHRVLRSLGDDGTSAAFVLDSLPDPFTGDELEQAMGALHDQLVTRRGATETIDRIRWVASANYEVTFPTGSSISERVLSPTAPIESHGMEDARFVRFVDDDGTATYLATYTAYDGTHVGSQLLTTVDFRTFTSTQLTGRGARNKGMALFPRRIGGRYVALSRWDRETNAIVTSDDPTVWDDPISLQRPAEPWDLIQLGNCGSPIESPAGWIVLTHGVGPMRRYAIGAELLDLDDPTCVIGHLREPLLTPAEEERDGYVPNVVYSCGAMLHREHHRAPVRDVGRQRRHRHHPPGTAPRPTDLTRGLEGLEPTSAGRDRRQRAVRLTVHAPPDGNRLSVEEVLPVALAHRRIRHLPKRDARRALARMNPSPVRRERRGVRGQSAACRTAGSGNLRRHRTATLLRPTRTATKLSITDLHDWFEHRRCPNFHTLGGQAGRACFRPLAGSERPSSWRGR